MMNSTLKALSQPEKQITSPQSELLLSGARDLIAQALEAELQVLLDQYAGYRLPDIRKALVLVISKEPKVRDQSGSVIRFSNNLLPPYIKRARNVEELMPWLYLKYVSTGDYQEALSSLLGAKLAVGDGALGFWKALSKPYPDTRHQRCWIQKTANILNTLSKSAQHKVKTALHEIWISETHDGAYKAFDRALVRFGSKYYGAMERLRKDRDELQAFYDFPADIAVVILGIYFGKQPKPTYRDCVQLNSSAANTLQIYEQPDRMSKSINYQPTSGKEQFWVAKRTADEQWVQLYHAITLFDDLPESAKLGWVSAKNINTLGIVECMTD